MAEEFSSEEAEAYADLAERAGVVARRILAERGLVYLDDLDPEAAREVLRTAWRCAIAQTCWNRILYIYNIVMTNRIQFKR